MWYYVKAVREDRMLYHNRPAQGQKNFEKVEKSS